jgi:hypothetical protein
VRYGLIALPLVAAFAGYAVFRLLPGRIGWLPAVAALALAATNVPMISSADTQILNDRGAQVSVVRQGTINWLRQNYDGGRLLMEVFKNNDVTFGARIDQALWVTEGNPQIYNAALRQPQLFVRGSMQPMPWTTRSQTS